MLDSSCDCFSAIFKLCVRGFSRLRNGSERTINLLGTARFCNSIFASELGMETRMAANERSAVIASTPRMKPLSLA